MACFVTTQASAVTHEEIMDAARQGTLPGFCGVTLREYGPSVPSRLGQSLFKPRHGDYYVRYTYINPCSGKKMNIDTAWTAGRLCPVAILETVYNDSSLFDQFEGTHPELRKVQFGDTAMLEVSKREGGTTVKLSWI